MTNILKSMRVYTNSTDDSDTNVEIKFNKDIRQDFKTVYKRLETHPNSCIELHKFDDCTTISIHDVIDLIDIELWDKDNTIYITMPLNKLDKLIFYCTDKILRLQDIYTLIKMGECGEKITTDYKFEFDNAILTIDKIYDICLEEYDNLGLRIIYK